MDAGVVRAGAVHRGRDLSVARNRSKTTARYASDWETVAVAPAWRKRLETHGATQAADRCPQRPGREPEGVAQRVGRHGRAVTDEEEAGEAAK